MCWGLITATVLTLVLVPAFYYVVDDARAWMIRRVRGAALQQELAAGGSYD
jgi:hypothetical protein